MTKSELPKTLAEATELFLVTGMGAMVMDEDGTTREVEIPDEIRSAMGASFEAGAHWMMAVLQEMRGGDVEMAAITLQKLSLEFKESALRKKREFEKEVGPDRAKAVEKFVEKVAARQAKRRYSTKGDVDEGPAPEPTNRDIEETRAAIERMKKGGDA